MTPPAPLPASWAGFYLGVHGGYGWERNSFSTIISTTPLVRIGGVNAQGAVFGAHAGYNWQQGRAVAGVELDFSAADIRGDSSPAVQDFGGGVTLTQVSSDNISYLGSARGRLGWTPTDTVLLYGTAGLGWERYKRIDTGVVNAPGVVQTSVGTTPLDRFGWVAGVGAEAMLFGTNWVGRVEYLHYDFDAVEIGQQSISTTPGNNFGDNRGRQTVDLLRAGLSYKFGELAPRAAPVYAKGPIMAAPATWAGFYLGVHGGYGWKENSFVRVLPTATPLATIGGIDSRGEVFGGQAGHNWQYGQTVAGLEIDFSGSNIKGSAVPVTHAAFGNVTEIESRADNVKYLGTARGRLGWTPVDNLLLYGTAGLGWERVERENGAITIARSFTQTFTVTTPFDRFGWVAGAGVEGLLFGTNLVGRLEYLHYDFGAVESGQSRTSTPGGSVADSRGKQHIDLVRAAVSYKFGEPAAAPARPIYTKGPAIPPPMASWAGFYLGVHGGYGWERNTFKEEIGGPLATLGDVKAQGAVYGGHVGYNWQYGRAVAGLEIDFSATGIMGDSNTLVRDGGHLVDLETDKISYLGTARGRLGWAPSDTVLFYGTAGLAWERYKRLQSESVVNPPAQQTNVITTPFDRFGWVAGVGAEAVLFGTNWIARLEYLHYDFGAVEIGVTVDNTVVTNRGNQSMDVVRAGVSYKLPPT